MKKAGKGVEPTPSLQRIYYVLETFPKLSETFVVEEIFALIDLGLDIHLMAKNKGSFEVLHPGAQMLVSKKRVKFLSDVSRRAILFSLAYLFIRRRSNTVRVLAKALKAEDRWRYFQALPFAVDASKYKSQYVHAHFADENAWIASAIADWADLPFGITLHGYDVRFPPLPQSILSRVVSKAATIVTVSEYFKAYASSKINIAPERIYVAHNGVDVGRFSPPQHRTAHETCRLISVGRLELIKGHDILIKAIHLLRTAGHEVSVKLVGDGKERAELERQAREYRLESVVHFLGNQSPDSVIKHLQQSDIFVMPSRDESFGVACIEAMATELPVVVSRVGGLPEFVAQGETGLLFESENAEDLAAGIESLMADPEHRTRMGSKARELVQQKFSRGVTIRKLLNHFETIAKGH